MLVFALLLNVMLHPSVVVAKEADSSHVTTLTTEDIRRERPTDLVDLLRSRVGLDDRGGTLSMRGVPGVVVQIDGFIASMEALRLLKPEQVVEIKILRGAASAHFGAGAMGGAIMVTTEMPSAGHRFEWVAGLESSGSASTRFIGSHQGQGGGGTATGELQEKHGYRAIPEAPFPGQITVEKESGRQRTLDARFDFLHSAGHTQLSLKHADSVDRFGRPNWWWERTVDRIGVGSVMSGKSPWALHVSAAYETSSDEALRDRGTGIDPDGLAADRYIYSDHRQTELELAAEWKSERGALRVAVVGEQSAEFHNIVSYATREPHFTLDAALLNSAAYFRYEYRSSGGYVVDAGGRYDHYRYGDTTIHDVAAGAAPISGAPLDKAAFSPRLGLRRQSGGTLLSFNVGTGFVLPTPEQLYYEDINDSAQFLANPELKPQRSVTWDVGLRQALGSMQLGVTLFQSRWEEKLGVMIIDYGDPVKRQWRNIGKAEAQGVELELEGRLRERWGITFNYTLNHTRIIEDRVAPALMGNELPDMPRHKANLVLTYEGTDITGRMALRYMGTAYTDERNTVVDAAGYRWRKDEYAVVDVSTTWRFGAARLTLAAGNLFDEIYMTGFFRRSPGRVLRAEYSYLF
jgi:outer membrane receptor protein involved in Fe transport